MLFMDVLEMNRVLSVLDSEFYDPIIDVAEFEMGRRNSIKALHQILIFPQHCYEWTWMLLS